MMELMGTNPEILDSLLKFVFISVSSLWAFLKTTDVYQATKGKRYEKALRALEAAVEDVGRGFVAEAKQASKDGKLTKHEIDIARQRARRQAIEFGTNEGIDVLRELGEDYIELFISQAVSRAKGIQNKAA